MDIVCPDVKFERGFRVWWFLLGIMEIVDGPIDDAVDNVLRVSIVGKCLLESIEFSSEDLVCAGYFYGSINKGFHH